MLKHVKTVMANLWFELASTSSTNANWTFDSSGCMHLRRCQVTATTGLELKALQQGHQDRLTIRSSTLFRNKASHHGNRKLPFISLYGLSISTGATLSFQVHFSYLFFLVLIPLTSPNSGEPCRTLFPPRSTFHHRHIHRHRYSSASASSNANWSPTHFRLRVDLPWFAKGPLIRSFHMVSKRGFIMFCYHYLPPRIKSSDSWMLWHLCVWLDVRNLFSCYGGLSLSSTIDHFHQWLRW